MTLPLCSDFGCCPECGSPPYLFVAGRLDFAYCPACRLHWLIGAKNFDWLASMRVDLEYIERHSELLSHSRRVTDAKSSNADDVGNMGQRET